MTVRKRYIWGVTALFIAFLLQTTVLSHIAVFGRPPNLLLCLIVVFSFLYDEKIGLLSGIIFGLLLDFTVSIYMGPSAVAFLLVYLSAVIIRRVFNHEKLLPELLLAVIATPLYMLVTWLFYVIAGNPIPGSVLLSAVCVLTVYNGIIILILHLLLVRGVIKHRRDDNFKGSFKLRGGF